MKLCPSAFRLYSVADSFRKTIVPGEVDAEEKCIFLNNMLGFLNRHKFLRYFVSERIHFVFLFCYNFINLDVVARLDHSWTRSQCDEKFSFSFLTFIVN